MLIFKNALKQMESRIAILASKETEIAVLALEGQSPPSPEMVPKTLSRPLLVEATMLIRPPSSPPNWSLLRLEALSRVWLICMPYLDWKTTTCVCRPVSGSVVTKYDAKLQPEGAAADTRQLPLKRVLKVTS